MSQSEIQNCVNWCRTHAWGLNAEYCDITHQIINLDDNVYNSMTDKMETEKVSFDCFLSLRIWAGY